MMYWNIIIIAVCFLLLLFLLWKEVRRQNKTWLPARLLATIAAIAGLGALALPLYYNHKIKGNNTAAAVLLTEGFDADSVKNFLNKNPIVPIFTLVKNAVPDAYTYLPDATFLNNDSNRFSQLHVFGNGLNADELSSICNYPFIFHPPVAKTGITIINWNQQLTSGDKLRIQGSFINQEAASAKIVLVGFGVALDSTIISSKISSAFQLQTQLKHLGRAVYSIIIVSGKDTIANEPLPVEVISLKAIKVLLLAASPDFENKFLKNWLAQNSYQVVARTRISKDKFTIDYGNVSGSTMNGINASLLSRFDVVVADAAELAVISRPELAAIQSANSQQAIGLVVKLDSGSTANNFYSSNFPLVQERSNTPSTTKLHLLEDTAANTWQLKTVQPLYIRQGPGTQPLVQNEKGQIVVSSKLHGAGKIVATTLGNTYTWQLAGKQESYGSFWATLLGKVLKKEEQPEAFGISPKLPVVNEKATIQLQTSFSEPPQVLATASSISMEQDYQLPFLWQGFYWPQAKGWVPLSTSHQTVSWVYVYGKNDWQNVRATAKQRGMQNLAQPIAQLQQGQVTIKTIRAEIPKVYFFLLFLLSASFLWFEKKYNRG